MREFCLFTLFLDPRLRGDDKVETPFVKGIFYC